MDEQQRLTVNKKAVIKYQLEKEDKKHQEEIDALGEDFDIKTKLNEDQREIYISLMRIINNPKPSVKALEIAFKMLGILTDKREETIKFEPNYGEWTSNIISRLRDNFKEHGGICPVCSRPHLLDKKLRLHSESEHNTESEVEGVEIPVTSAEIISN